MLLFYIGGITKKQKISEIIKAELLTNNPKFVNLQKVPRVLMTRNGLLNTNLYIRSCYNDIYEEIKSDFSTVEQNHKQPNFAVIGTAGIGKSSFFLYFLWRYMEDEFFMEDKNDDKSFFYQTDKNNVEFFQNTKGFDFTEISLNIQDYNEFKHKKYPLFVDMETEDIPFPNHGLLIIFSSFKEVKYKERTKKGFHKLMPTWSYEEMSEYILSDTFGEDFGKNLEEKQNMLEMFEYFGGVVRSVVSKNKGLIDKAITAKGSLICQHYFKAGHGGIEDHISDVLIHRNPPKDADGKFLYEVLDEIFIYSFASQYIFRELVKNNKVALIKEAKQKYAVGTMSGGEDGKEFELLCFHTGAFSGVSFTATPLNGTEGLNDLNIVFPESEYLVRDWKTSNDYLKANVLYLPTIGNLESGDAFCVMELNGVTTLIVMQVTIASSHPVKMNGLKTICDCFGNTQVNITDKILIFITPIHGTLNSKQNLHSTQNTKVEDKNIPVNIKPFSKNQFKIENNLEK